MIVTNLNSPELSLYSNLNKYFMPAFEAIREAMASDLEPGRYDIDGDECYYMVQKYQTKPASEAKFESHREYIDIQVILKGEEIIRMESLDKLTRATEYTPDCELFEMNDEYDSVRLATSDLMIIYPGEAHAPCLQADGADGDVTKIVVKIRNA